MLAEVVLDLDIGDPVADVAEGLLLPLHPDEVVHHPLRHRLVAMSHGGCRLVG